MNDPKAEFSDTEKGFKFRLTWNGEASKWYSHYQGILVHTFSNGRKWGLCSAYWEGAPDSSLPIETPFEIIVARSASVSESSNPQPGLGYKGGCPTCGS